MAARKLTSGAVARCLAGVGDGCWEGREAAPGLCGAPVPTRKGGEAVRRSLCGGRSRIRTGEVTGAHLRTNGRWRVDNLQWRGVLMYPHDWRTDRTARMAARAHGEWDSSARQLGGACIRAVDCSEGDNGSSFT
jgi:hypothetical protein